MTAPVLTARVRRAMPRASAARAGTWLPPLLLLAALLGLWEGWVWWRDVEPFLLPAPSAVWAAFLESRPLLGDHLLTTATEALAGLVLGAAVGAALAVVIAATPLARRVLYPILVVSQTVPMIVLAPLLVLWFGFGMTPKIVVVALIVFFPVAVSTVAGLAGADRDLVELVRSMGADRRQILRMVLFPAAVPAFFAGLRIAAAYAVAGAVIGEWVGASQGLGIFITRSQSSFQVDRVFVAVTIVALLSMTLFGLVHLLARRASPWMYLTSQKETP
ncbi:ABC transporter permease [soil metagenome]